MEVEQLCTKNCLQAISDMIDNRKSQGISANTQRNFTIAEIYICRGKRTLTRRKWLEWSEELTVENLEAVNAWATLEEVQQVIPYHFRRYSEVLQKCKKGLDSDVPSHDLTFPTRFLSVYLFIQVKSSRPMTYQYLTVTMFHNSKIRCGFVDQTEFKTAQQYTFDSLLCDKKSTELTDNYIGFVRPRLHPKCDYVLVTRNGTQYSKLSDLMSRLVYEAIGKHIHPTRYRQQNSAWGNNTLSVVTRNTVLTLQGLIIRKYSREMLQPRHGSVWINSEVNHRLVRD